MNLIAAPIAIVGLTMNDSGDPSNNGTGGHAMTPLFPSAIESAAAATDDDRGAPPSGETSTDAPPGIPPPSDDGRRDARPSASDAPARRGASRGRDGRRRRERRPPQPAATAASRRGRPAPSSILSWATVLLVVVGRAAGGGDAANDGPPPPGARDGGDAVKAPGVSPRRASPRTLAGVPCEERADEGSCGTDEEGNVNFACFWGGDDGGGCITLPGVGPASSSSDGVTPSPSPATSFPPTVPGPAAAPATAEPTERPAEEPATPSPVDPPSRRPSDEPSRKPSPGPTEEPSDRPTVSPTESPSDGPTPPPTGKPTKRPTKPPTKPPSDAPSVSPTFPPSDSPSASPTKRPSDGPTQGPTTSARPTPLLWPSYSPTASAMPSASPTYFPTASPSSSPLDPPTSSPARGPTPPPTPGPTPPPTSRPTSGPTPGPTPRPTSRPTPRPTSGPTPRPTPAPAAPRPAAPALSYMVPSEMVLYGVRELDGDSAQAWIGVTEGRIRGGAEGIVGDDGEGLAVSVSLDASGRRRRGLQSSRTIRIAFTTAIDFESDEDDWDPNGMVAAGFETEDGREEYLDALRAADGASFGSVERMTMEVDGRLMGSDPSMPVEPQVEPQVDHVLYYVIGGAAGGTLLLLAAVVACWKRKSTPPPPPLPPPSPKSLPQDALSLEDARPRLPAATTTTAPSSENYFGTIESKEGEDDVSTIGFPYFGEGHATDPGPHADNTVDESMMSSEQRMYTYGVGRERLNTGGQSTITGGGGPQNMFVDDNTFEGAYRNPDGSGEARPPALERLVAIAPSGKLGIVVDNQTGDMPVVHAIKETSVLKGKIKVGDLLVTVDGIDCKGMSAVQVSKLISSLSRNPARTLVLLRGPGC